MAAVCLGAIDLRMGLFFAAGCGVAAIIAPAVSLWAGAGASATASRRSEICIPNLQTTCWASRTGPVPAGAKITLPATWIFNNAHPPAK